MKGMDVMIGAVLLMAIVVGLAVILTNFASSLFKSETSNIEERAGSCTDRDLSVEEAYLEIPSGKARATVRNAGFVDDVIKSAVLLTVKGEQGPNITQFPLSIAKGTLVTLEFNITGKITACGNFSKIVVSTDCASTQNTKQPQCIS
jgi:hypothetical protein